MKNAGARLDGREAIDAPRARTATPRSRSKLEKVVAADTATGDKELLMADDVVAKVAARLRARAQ